MGGRLDATNVLDPLLTLTTDISRDHIEILGDTIDKLAWEKGGIIKPNTPHLVARIRREAMTVINSIARDLKAPLYRLSRNDYHLSVDLTRLDFHDDCLSLENLTVGMPGQHQLHNAALALKSISLLKSHYRLKSSKKSIRIGLKNAVWPGRFQVIKRPGHPTLILDVCHNAGSVAAYVDAFKRLFPGQKTHILTGFVKRKEHQLMLDLLSRVARSYALVPLATKRTTDIDDLIKQLDWQAIPLQRFGRLRTAYNKLLKSSGPNDIISVIGSHFLVGEFLEENGWP